MYECVGLSKKNLNDFKRLNSTRNSFNRLNEDFFEVYDKCNFAQQIFLRRRVKLLKRDTTFIGYIWADIDDNNLCSVNALNVIRDVTNVEGSIPYKFLLDTLKKDCSVTYLCESNQYNYEILKNLGFIKKDGMLMLYLNMTENIPLILHENLQFEVLKKGQDEHIRCEIQNNIFKEDTRIPLAVEDIYFDEVQSYYFEKGSVFLKKDGRHIGYGQVIIEHNTPVIVNFGILKAYRGKGYSKSLLTYLLKIIQCNGFNDVKMKVKSTNTVALNLYRGIGFKVTGETYNWKLEK